MITDEAQTGSSIREAEGQSVPQLFFILGGGGGGCPKSLSP